MHYSLPTACLVAKSIPQVILAFFSYATDSSSKGIRFFQFYMPVSSSVRALLTFAPISILHPRGLSGRFENRPKP